MGGEYCGWGLIGRFTFYTQIVLETEITNKSALRLYENLGFVRDKRLFRYYLNGVDALRLKLWLKWNKLGVQSLIWCQFYLCNVNIILVITKQL